MLRRQRATITGLACIVIAAAMLYYQAKLGIDAKFVDMGTRTKRVVEAASFFTLPIGIFMATTTTAGVIFGLKLDKLFDRFRR